MKKQAQHLVSLIQQERTSVMTLTNQGQIEPFLDESFFLLYQGDWFSEYGEICSF